MTPPLVTVILPCRNEERYIGPCLESILATHYPHDRIELLVVDGRSDDRTRDIVAICAERHPGVIQLLDNPRRVVPAALNIGVRAATGEIIARMDAHVVYPPDYLPRLVAALEESGADNVGGCIVTLPADRTPAAQAIALALGHRFGVGNSYFRIGTDTPRWVDTVPFGCFRRDVFERVGLFDEDLVRNQDDEFNHRLIRHGGRIRLLPDVLSFYYARGSHRQIARMYYQYGFFKPLVARKLGAILTARQLAPPAFLLGLVGGGLAAPFAPLAALAWATVLGAYVGALLLCTVPVVRTHGWRCGLALLGAFPVLHLSYGFGFLRGAWSAFAARPRWQDPAAIPMSR